MEDRNMEWDGRQKVAYFRSIPEMGWILVLAQEREEVLRPITSMLYSNIILVTVSILIVGLIIFTFALKYQFYSKASQFRTTIAEGNSPFLLKCRLNWIRQADGATR